AEPAVASMPVELSIPAFKIKAQFLFGKVVLLAGGGSVNRLLNVMILRPNLAGVDFATGYIPDTAPVVQTTPQQLYSYGGSEGGDSAVARLTMFFRHTNPYGTGFLPDYRNTGWGVNFPTAADATSDAEFMRLTPELGKIVN